MAVRIYWKYFWVVMYHKWLVLLECRKSGYILFGLLHDLSKFYPDEFGPYARYWGKKPEERTAEVIESFEKAKVRHEKRNKHHYEYWIRFDGRGKPYAAPMDSRYVIEMFCDWRAAGFVYKGKDDSREYFMRAGPTMLLHPETKEWIEEYYEIVWNSQKNIYQKWEEADIF